MRKSVFCWQTYFWKQLIAFYRVFLQQPATKISHFFVFLVDEKECILMTNIFLKNLLLFTGSFYNSHKNILLFVFLVDEIRCILLKNNLLLFTGLSTTTSHKNISLFGFLVDEKECILLTNIFLKKKSSTKEAQTKLRSRLFISRWSGTWRRRRRSVWNLEFRGGFKEAKSFCRKNNQVLKNNKVLPLRRQA